MGMKRNEKIQEKTENCLENHTKNISFKQQKHKLIATKYFKKQSSNNSVSHRFLNFSLFKYEY